MKAYEHLHGDGGNLIRHLGPSFGTKFLYFAGYGRISGNWQPLILDWYVAPALTDLCGFGWPTTDWSTPQDAALLLASASIDPSAPPVTGDDVPRYRELQRQIIDQIGTDAHQRLADQAALLPRAQVLDRALAALAATTHG